MKCPLTAYPASRKLLAFLIYLAVLVIAYVALAPAAHAATLPATPATFAAVNAKAQPGDVVLFGPGAWGDRTVRRPGVTYRCAPGVGLAGVTFGGPNLRTFFIIAPGDDVTFDGLGCRIAYTPNANSTSSSPVVKAAGVKRPTFRNLTMTEVGGSVVGVPETADPNTPRPGDNVLGRPTATAVMLQDVTGAVVDHVEASGFFAGIATAGVTDTAVTNNNLHDLRTSCIHGGAIANLTLGGNTCRNSKPWNEGGKGDHVDCDHIWTRDGGQPITGLVIKDERCIQTLPVPGISLDDNGRGIGFVGAVIVGNTILSAHASGIVPEHCIACIITDNHLDQTAGDKNHGPSIWLADGTTATVQRNTGPDLHNALAARPASDGNVILKPTAASIAAMAKQAK